MARFCDHSNEPSCSINVGNFLISIVTINFEEDPALFM